MPDRTEHEPAGDEVRELLALLSDADAWLALRALWKAGGATQKELIAKTGLDKSSASRTLIALRSHGLIRTEGQRNAMHFPVPDMRVRVLAIFAGADELLDLRDATRRESRERDRTYRRRIRVDVLDGGDSAERTS